MWEVHGEICYLVKTTELKDIVFVQDRRNRRSRTASMDIESMKDSSGVADVESSVVGQSDKQTSEAIHE